MRYRRAVLIYNPVSGRRSLFREAKIKEAREALTRWIPEVDRIATECPGDASRLAREAVEAGCDLIAACGGDGTINEVIGGMAGSDATLLPLPAGTANVLAGVADLPTRPDLTAALLPELTTYEVPLGRVRTEGEKGAERLFLLMCGIGVDAGIIYNLDTRLKAYLGEGAYWLGSLDQLHRKLEPFTVRLDGETHEATFVLVSKSRYYGGGLEITPNAELLAAEFEVAIFHGRSPLRYVGYLAQLAARRLDSFPDVTFCRAKRVEASPLDAPAVYIEVDGELAGRVPAVVDIAPEKLKLLLPRDFAEAMPSESAAKSVAGVAL